MNERKNNKSGRFAWLVVASAGLGWAPPTLKPGGSSPAPAAARSTSGRWLLSPASAAWSPRRHWFPSVRSAPALPSPVEFRR